MLLATALLVAVVTGQGGLDVPLTKHVAIMHVQEI